MESGRTCNDQRTPKYLKLAIALFGVLVLQACSQTGADVVAVAADSAVVEEDVPVAEPTIEELLVGTRWNVVDMIGFPSDTVVAGSFQFRSEVIFFDDGSNGGGAPIVWTDTGFVLTDSATTTDVEALPQHDLTELFVFKPEDSSISTSLDGQTLTLTRDELTVIAEQR